jgi:hypothetical protein
VFLQCNCTSYKMFVGSNRKKCKHLWLVLLPLKTKVPLLIVLKFLMFMFELVSPLNGVGRMCVSSTTLNLVIIM